MARKILEEKVLIEGITTCIMVDNYYDLHGSLIKEPPTNFNYKKAVPFKIVEQTIEMTWHFSDEPTIWTVWELFINNKPKDIEADITAYGFDPKTKILKLRACTGAG